MPELDNSDLPPSPNQTQPKINSAGRPYDSATGKLLPKSNDSATPTVQPEAVVEATVTPQVTQDAKPEAQPTPPPVPTHSPILLQAARQFGIPESYAKSVSAEQLRADVELQATLSRTHQPKQVQAPVEEAFDWGIDPETGEKRTEKSYDPAVARLMKNNHELTKRLDGVTKLFEHQQKQNFHAQVDQLFNTDTQTFGAGTAADLLPGSEELERRELVYGQLVRMTKGQPGVATEQAFNRLKRLLVVNQPQAPLSPTQMNGRITEAQWQSGGLAPTTHRSAIKPELTRRERMIQEEAAKMREQGTRIQPVFDNSDLPPPRN